MHSDQDDWMEAWITCALSVRQRDIEEEVSGMYVLPVLKQSGSAGFVKRSLPCTSDGWASLSLIINPSTVEYILL